MSNLTLHCPKTARKCFKTQLVHEFVVDWDIDLKFDNIFWKVPQKTEITIQNHHIRPEITENGSKMANWSLVNLHLFPNLCKNIYPKLLLKTFRINCSIRNGCSVRNGRMAKYCHSKVIFQQAEAYEQRLHRMLHTPCPMSSWQRWDVSVKFRHSV